MEETVPSKLRSKGSLRVSSGWGPRSRAEADVWILVRLAWRPWLGNRGPWAWARSQSLPLPPAPGDAQRCARGETAAPERVKRARVCAGPDPPPRPPTPACTPHASVDTSEQPAESLGPVPNSQGEAYELGVPAWGRGRDSCHFLWGKENLRPTARQPGPRDFFPWAKAS